MFQRPEFVDGEGFYYLGKHYRLKLFDVPPDGPPVPTVHFIGDRLLLRREQSGIWRGADRGILYTHRSSLPEFLGQAMEINRGSGARSLRRGAGPRLPMGLVQRRRNPELPLARHAVALAGYRLCCRP